MREKVGNRGGGEIACSIVISEGESEEESEEEGEREDKSIKAKQEQLEEEKAALMQNKELLKEVSQAILPFFHFDPSFRSKKSSSSKCNSEKNC